MLGTYRKGQINRKTWQYVKQYSTTIVNAADLESDWYVNLILAVVYQHKQHTQMGEKNL